MWQGEGGQTVVPLSCVAPLRRGDDAPAGTQTSPVAWDAPAGARRVGVPSRAVGENIGIAILQYCNTNTVQYKWESIYYFNLTSSHAKTYRHGRSASCPRSRQQFAKHILIFARIWQISTTY